MPFKVTLEIAERYTDTCSLMVSKLNHNFSKGNRLKELSFKSFIHTDLYFIELHTTSYGLR